MKYIFSAFAAILLLVSCKSDNSTSPEDIVMKLRESNKLYVTEYVVQKIVTADDVKRVNGKILNKQFSLKLPIGDRKIAIPMEAVIKAYIDFDSLQPSDVRIDSEGRKISLTLPAPAVELTSSKIDNKGIREYTDLLRTSFSDAEISEFEHQGRAAVLEAIPHMGIDETARANATALLKPMLMQMGYEADNIEIVYKKQTNK